MFLVETRKYQTKSNLHCLLLFNFPSLSQRQITFLGSLELRNLFGPKDKVSSHEKLVFRSGVRFLFLFVLTDTILLKLDLQKRTLILVNPPNEKLFVYEKWSTYQTIGDILFFSYIKATIGQCANKVNLGIFWKEVLILANDARQESQVTLILRSKIFQIPSKFVDYYLLFENIGFFVNTPEIYDGGQLLS